jgi:quinol monooxygenase YgiN
MIMSLLEFKLKPGKEGALKEVFLKHQILETAIQVEGCWKLAMIAPQNPDSTVKIIGFWEDNIAYQRWEWQRMTLLHSLREIGPLLHRQSC